MNRKQLIGRLRKLGWVILVPVVLVILMRAAQKRKVTPTADMDIQIERLAGADSTLINRGDVIKIINERLENRVLGDEIKNVEVERLERVLEENPFVKNADVFINAQHVVHIYLTQREPIVRIKDAEGRDYYLDEEGNYIPPSNHYAARVVVVTGFVTPHEPNFVQKKQHGLKPLFELIKILHNDPFYLALIEQLHIEQNGDLLFVPKLGSSQILFGKINEVEEKLDRLRIFYEQAIPYEGWDKYSVIDIRFKDQVVCRK